MYQATADSKVPVNKYRYEYWMGQRCFVKALLQFETQQIVQDWIIHTSLKR